MSTEGHLLERDEELALLSRALADPDARLVLVRGEAGIGKTALIRTFLESHEDEINALYGASDDLSTPQPFGPLWDVARTEPSLLEALERADRPAVLNALLELFDRTLRPTVLILEDTQWADEATLDVIKYIGRRLEQTHGLLILTYREGEVDYSHPLRVVIGEIRPTNLLRIRLTGLSTKGIASMVHGTSLDIEEIVSMTDGNPLFVSEMLNSASEKIPISIQDSVIARAAKLPRAARSTLNLLSVMPGQVDRQTLEAFEVTPDVLDEATKQGLIEQSVEGARFQHELTRRAVESALGDVERRRLNARVLSVLAQAPGVVDPAILVHHAREAGDIEGIVAHAPVAAKAARAVDAHDEAVAHFRTLEPHLDRIEAPRRAAIYMDWAISEALYLFHYREAGEILDRSIQLYRQIGDLNGLAEVLLLGVRIEEMNENPDASDRRMAEVLSIVERGDQVHPARPKAVATQSWVTLMRGDDERTIELADKAIRLATELGDEPAHLSALTNKGSSAFRLGDRNGLALLDDVRARARKLGNAFEEMRALHNAIAVALRSRQLGLADRLARQGIDLAAGMKLTNYESYFRANHAEVMLHRGNCDATDEFVSEALASGHEVIQQQHHLDWLYGRLGTRKGRPDAKRALLHSWESISHSRQIQNMTTAAAALAENLWVTGDTDPSLVEDFTGLLKSVIELGNRWDSGDLALWLWKMDRLDAVPGEIAEPYRLIIDGRAEEAAREWDRLGYVYEKAIALSGADTDSQLQAIEELETLGANAVAAKLRQELRDQGVNVPRGRARATRDHPVGLTSRQSEVLSLLAEGLSNVDIADLLFLSPRTVEHHVSAILTKLGAADRDEAVEKAGAEGILDHQ